MLDALEQGDPRVAKLVLDRIWPLAVGEVESKPTVVLRFDAQDAEA